MAEVPEEIDDDAVGLELGDTILILGGQFNKTVGKLYGFFTDRMLIQVKGQTDRVVRIPLVDGAPDEELEIQDIIVLKKAPRPGFITMVDLRAGQYVETFGPAVRGVPEPTGTFKVISVNEETDSIVLEDTAGIQTTVNFDFEGISPELPFEVLRTREAPGEERGAAPAAQAEGDAAEPAPVSRVAVDDEDILEQGQAPSAKEDAEDLDATHSQVNFALGAVIELPEDDELKEVGTADRLYNDVFQRSEMLSQLIRLLPQAQRRDPLRLQEVRRFVEQMLILRNQVVKYNVTGDPAGIQATSMHTLAELIQRPDVTLSRKIAAITKVLYIDHTNAHMMAEAAGERGQDPNPGIVADGIYADYLTDVIARAGVLDAAAEVDQGTTPGASKGMPPFFLNMERYRQQIQTPFQLAGGGVPVEKDEEVFRREAPSTEEPNLNGLAEYPPIKKGVSAIITNPPIIVQVPFGVTRLLKQRWSHFLEGDAFRVVEPAEAPSYTNILVFPLSALRDVGPIRSGSLAQDMALGAMTAKTMDDILIDLGEISDFPTAESILNLGVKGNIVGNVTIKDWLASMNLRPSGLGDAWSALRGYGAQNIEWSIDQAKVIQDKIEQRLAALRLFMIRQREENNAMLANLKFVPQQMLADADAARLLSRVESEPLLQKVLTDVREYMGDLANVDINWFTYLFLAYPDLLLAALGQQAGQVAKERLRHVRQLYINATHAGYRVKRKLIDSGEIPTPNMCPHVKRTEDLRKAVRTLEDEPRDVTKVKLLVKLLNDFRGETKDNWVWCKVCNQHLICAHELIYIQEFLRPAEKEILHKEMTINFSGGQFSGRYICRVCGQMLAELEFDQTLEFDDEGRPMMGRSVMVDRDAIEADELENMLKGPAEGDEEISFGNESLNEMYRSLRRIASGLGVEPEDRDYRTMVEEMSGYISSLPTREGYAIATRGKKAQDFDIFYSIRYVSAAAAILLLNIQTRTPDYVVYYTTTDCKDGFLGYPLEGEGNTTGIQCIASIVGGINDKEFPWNMTTLQRKDNLVARRDALMPLIKGQIDIFIKNPIHQVALKKKREYRTKLFGKVGGAKSDQIASSFRPVPYVLEPAAAAADAVVAAAATPEKQAIAWIRAAHGIARANAALNPDAPLSETTSCLNLVTKPLSFWAEKGLPTLDAQVSRGTGRTGTLNTTFYTEAPKVLEGKIDEKDYYKLFAALCHTGDRKGLPHELGITLTCTECGLNFKTNPRLPATVQADPKKQLEEESKAGAELQAHIVSQGVIINEETAQNLLDTAHMKLTVPKVVMPFIPRSSAALGLLAATEAFEGWAEIIANLQVTLAELGPGASKIQIAKAAEQLVQKISEKEEFIRGRLGSDVFRYIETLTKKSPREAGEAVSAFLLVPFKRWLSGLAQTSFQIQKTYELSSETRQDIMGRGLGGYLRTVGEEVELKGLLLRKVRRFVEDLSELCKNIFTSVRSILIPGGEMMTAYLMRAYMMGTIQRFVDPHFIPEGEEELEGAGGGAVNMKVLYKALAQAMTKYAVGSKVPTEGEIRTSLEKRVEKEKQQFIGEMDKMSRDRRKVELTLKSLGMGKWAAGGGKAIRQYDPERYEVERTERAAAGITDYADIGGANAADGEGRAVDMFGMDFGGEYDAGAERMDGDYTDGAMREDEY